MPEIQLQSLHPAFQRQMAALESRNLEDLLANYHPQAALLRFEGASEGLAQIREVFTGYLSLKPELVELTQYIETDDTIFYRAIMNLGGEPEHAFGTLVIRDGKVWRQTAGFGS
jgi:hypothetical protein